MSALEESKLKGGSFVKGRTFTWCMGGTAELRPLSRASALCRRTTAAQ